MVEVSGASVPGPADQWDELLSYLASLEAGTGDADTSVEVALRCGRLHLVQPFDWKAWVEIAPPSHDAVALSWEDCVRHVTRIVRAERFAEGSLMASVRSGELRALCERVADLQDRGRPPSLPKTTS